MGWPISEQWSGQSRCQVDRLKGKNREEEETSNWKFQKPTVSLVYLKLKVSGKTLQKGWGCWLRPHEQVNLSKSLLSVGWSSRRVGGEQKTGKVFRRCVKDQLWISHVPVGGWSTPYRHLEQSGCVSPRRNLLIVQQWTLWTEPTVVKQNYMSPTHQTNSLSWWRLHWFDTSGKLRQLLFPQVLCPSSVAWETSNRRPHNHCKACNAIGFTFASHPSWWASSRLWRCFTGLVETPHSSVEDRRWGWMCSAALGLWNTQLVAPQSHLLPQLTMLLSLKFF